MLEYQQAYVFLDGRIVEFVRSMLTVIRIPTIAWIVGSIKTFCRRNLHRKNIESRSKKYTNTLILLPFISRRLTFIRGSAIKSRIIENKQTCVCEYFWTIVYVENAVRSSGMWMEFLNEPRILVDQRPSLNIPVSVSSLSLGEKNFVRVFLRFQKPLTSL